MDIWETLFFAQLTIRFITVLARSAETSVVLPLVFFSFFPLALFSFFSLPSLTLCFLPFPFLLLLIFGAYGVRKVNY